MIALTVVRRQLECIKNIFRSTQVNKSSLLFTTECVKIIFSCQIIGCILCSVSKRLRSVSARLCLVGLVDKRLCLVSEHLRLVPRVNVTFGASSEHYSKRLCLVSECYID